MSDFDFSTKANKHIILFYNSSELGLYGAITPMLNQFSLLIPLMGHKHFSHSHAEKEGTHSGNTLQFVYEVLCIFGMLNISRLQWIYLYLLLPVPLFSSKLL